MPRRVAPVSIALVLALLAAVSCTRSGLRLGEGSEGDGGGGQGAAGPAGPGSGGSGQGGGAGAGGHGGAPVACDLLVQAGPPIGPSAAAHQRPALVDAGEGQVAVVFGVPSLMGNPKGPHVAYSSFPAWGIWPASAGQPLRLAESGGATHVAGEALGSGFAALVALVSPPDPPCVHPCVGVRFASAVALGTQHEPYPPGVWLASYLPGRPLFVARGASAHLVGHELDWGGGRQLVVGAGTDGLGHEESGCATGRLVADAAAAGPGHLVAFSSGRPFGSCYDDDGVVGPATSLQIARFHLNAGEATLADELSTTDPLGSVRILRRPGGFWLLFQEDGSTAFSPPPVFAVRLAADGKLEESPVELLPSGLTLGFAATTLDDRVVLAWIDAIDPGPPQLVVRVLDGTSSVAEAIVPAGFGASADRLSLLPSPAGDALLVAWSAYSPDADEPEERVSMVRFECAGFP